MSTYQNLPTDDVDTFEATTQFDRDRFGYRADLMARSRGRRRELVFGGIGALVFAALVVGCVARDGAGSDSQAAPTSVAAAPPSIPPPSDTLAGASAALGDAMGGTSAADNDPDNDPDADAEDDDGVTGDSGGWVDQHNPQPPAPDGEGDGEGATEIPPGPEQEPHPCDALAADGSSLVAYPDPIVLESNVMDGAFQFTNCSDGDVAYTLAVNPKVALDHEAGTVLPGETGTAMFTIDADAYGDGAIAFKIKVLEIDTGHSHYVDVHAYNPLLGTEAAADVGLTAGDGVGGCSNQCIVSALLRPNLQTPNVALDVVTDTPAKLRVYVSTEAPVVGDDGPSFGDLDPVDVSPAGVTEWTAQLEPLNADTTYHIILRATDADGDVDVRHGSFHTITPLDNPGGLLQPGDAPGCANQCITQALLTPGVDETVKHLSVRTHTPAMLQAFVADEAPEWDGDEPSFADTDVWSNSGLEFAEEWETDLVGLVADTDYHIIVRAEDDHGRVSYRVGMFRSAAAPTVDVHLTLVGVHVDRDGDKIGRGEVGFGWAVGDDDVALFGERKVDDGDWVTFGADASHWSLYDVSGVLPTIHVAAMERDPDLLGEFCSMGIAVPFEQGHDDKCDVKWNVAASGIVFTDDLAALPACTDFGLDASWAGIGCLVVASLPNGDDYPSITALVAVQLG